MRVELRDIHKFYGEVHANRGVSLVAEPGTIHGLLGENGAGKSTLMKTLAGFTAPSRGRILLDGREVAFASPADAVAAGVGMLYQDPLDFPGLTGAENFALGLRRRPAARPSFRDQLRQAAEELGFALHPDTPVERLTVGERQQLEVVRLLALGVRVLILDEPTTGISALQKDALFASLRRLAEEGRTVLLVSHKLEDVEALCHEVTVLRQGQVTGTRARPLPTDEVLELMFGAPPAPPPHCEAPAGEPVLTFRGASAPGGRAGLRECTVTVRAGEVVGLAGVEGSGQGVFLRLAAGLQRPRHGEVAFRGEPIARPLPDGVRFLPAGRLEEGLVEGMTIAEHCALNWQRIPFFVPWDRARRDAEAAIGTHRIRGRPDSPVDALSGGNQQRVLLSLLPEDPALLLLENPTRGLDLHSANWVWGHLRRYCEQGTAVVFSSAELDEILQVARRVLVFYEGAVVLDAPVDGIDPDRVAAAIAGRVP
ncbi:MAG: ATP-binding cassette domain-containing protein [Deferrisomatales bacterium]